jgi:CheY-like chemotaxis protein
MKVILLVDDTQELRDLMGHYLESSGYQVLYAINGAEALRMVKRLGKKIDGVVTDLNMPIMSGAELVTQVRSIGFEKPIIMWSGDVDPKIQGLSCFIHKNQNKEVVAMLNALLNETA